MWCDLCIIQLHSVSQLQAQRGQHQVPGNVVIVGQSCSRKVTAQRNGIQQQLLQLFGHHSCLCLVQAHVHRVRNHIGGDQTLIILQEPEGDSINIWINVVISCLFQRN